MAVTAIKQDKARSIPTPESLVERARAMIPALKERGAKAEADRKIPEETIREFKEAGFFDILKPKRWGGFEMDPRVFYQVQMAIAEGCMSSAWVYGVIGVHPYQLGLFDGKAQDDVWSKDQSILISSSYQPVGKVERVDGGFKLSGQWGFSSGCEHCDWTFLGAMIPPAEAGGPGGEARVHQHRQSFKKRSVRPNVGGKDAGGIGRDVQHDRSQFRANVERCA